MESRYSLSHGAILRNVYTQYLKGASCDTAVISIPLPDHRIPRDNSTHELAAMVAFDPVNGHGKLQLHLFIDSVLIAHAMTTKKYSTTSWYDTIPRLDTYTVNTGSNRVWFQPETMEFERPLVCEPSMTASSISFHVSVSMKQVTIERDMHEREQWLANECHTAVALALGSSVAGANMTNFTSVCLESIVEDPETGQFTENACHDVCKTKENTTLFVSSVL